MRTLLKIAVSILVILMISASVSWVIWDATSRVRYRKAMDRYETLGLPTSIRKLRPIPVSPEDNAAPLYLSAIELSDAIPDFRFADFPLVSTEMRRALEHANEALRRMREAGERPRCVYHRYEDGYRMEYFPAVKLLKPARLLAVRSLVRAERNDLDGALDDLRTLFRTSRSLDEEPGVFGQIIRMSISKAGLDALEVILPHFDSANDALQQAEVDSVSGAVAQGFRGEAACATGWWFHEEERADFFATSLPELNWLLHLDPLSRPYLRSEISSLLRFFHEHVVALEKPYPEAITALKELSINLDARGVFGLFVFSAAGVLEGEAECVSRATLASLAARCLDYRRAKGEYPESLKDLGIPSGTLDPLTEKPYVIVRREGAVWLENTGGKKVSWRLPAAG